MYILLYVKQIINKDPVYNIKNSTEDLVIIYLGKESEKEVC